MNSHVYYPNNFHVNARRAKANNFITQCCATLLLLLILAPHQTITRVNRQVQVRKCAHKAKRWGDNNFHRQTHIIKKFMPDSVHRSTTWLGRLGGQVGSSQAPRNYTLCRNWWFHSKNWLIFDENEHFNFFFMLPPLLSVVIVTAVLPIHAAGLPTSISSGGGLSSVDRGTLPRQITHTCSGPNSLLKFIGNDMTQYSRRRAKISDYFCDTLIWSKIFGSAAVARQAQAAKVVAIFYITGRPSSFIMCGSVLRGRWFDLITPVW